MHTSIPTTCIPLVFFVHSFFFSILSFLSFYLSFLLLFLPPPFHYSQLPLFIPSTIVGFTIFTLQLLLAPYRCPSRTAHWPASCLTTTSAQSVLVAQLSIPRQNLLVLFLTSLRFHFTHPDKD